MIDDLGQNLLGKGVFDILLIVFGYVLGKKDKWKFQLGVAMFVLRATKWWLETHPHGKKIVKEKRVDLTTEINKVFGISSEQIEAKQSISESDEDIAKDENSGYAKKV